MPGPPWLYQSCPYTAQMPGPPPGTAMESRLLQLRVLHDRLRELEARFPGSFSVTSNPLLAGGPEAPDAELLEWATLRAQEAEVVQKIQLALQRHPSRGRLRAILSR
jgi:hypothetical protein